MNKVTATARIAAIGLLVAAGVCLLTVSPILLLLGAWGGSDIGSVADGIASIVGLPWLVYAASVAVAVVLIHHRWNMLALAVALVPAAAETWIVLSFRH